MIIWRGFGFVAVVLVALAALAVTGINSAAGSPLPGYVAAGLGISIGGILTAAFGWWFNMENPKRKASEWAQQRRAELEHAVQTGTFQIRPGIPASSREEAETVSEQMLASESASVAKRLKNIHTLFFIPVQFIGVIAIVLGIVVAAVGS